jgi:hypothetical protein
MVPAEMHPSPLYVVTGLLDPWGNQIEILQIG